MTQKREKDNSADPDTPFLEWVFGAIGLALFLGAILVSSINAAGVHKPPSIAISAGPPTAADGRFHVPYSAFNSGDETAADVQLTARLMSGNEIVEEASGAIDLLPGQATHRGGVFFMHDPAGLRIEILPLGYQEP